MYIVGSVSTVTDSYHSLIIQEGHMKTGVNNLKKGNVILINNALHEVIDYYNTQPGKGGAFSQIKLRNMDTGSIFEKDFVLVSQSNEPIWMIKKSSIFTAMVQISILWTMSLTSNSH